MQHSVIYSHSSRVHKPSYFSIWLQVGFLVLIPGNSTGNLYVLLHKLYKMNTAHKNKRVQQIVPQNKHQLLEVPCSFVNTPHKICSDYWCFGLFMHLVPIISLDNLYSVVPTAHTNIQITRSTHRQVKCPVDQTGCNIHIFHNMQFNTMDGIKWLISVFIKYRR
jgi:hypothetical protein